MFPTTCMSVCYTFNSCTCTGVVLVLVNFREFCNVINEIFFYFMEFIFLPVFSFKYEIALFLFPEFCIFSVFSYNHLSVIYILSL